MRTSISGILAACLALAVACGTTSTHETGLDSEVRDTIQLFKNSDADIGKLFDAAYGYAVFPHIGKGAIGIGGAHGDGEVFEHGKWVGDVEMSQVTIGAQLGAQRYSEVIFFESKASLEDFKAGNYEVNAQVSAVAAAEGASANARFIHGVLVFTIADTGLMFEASVGGQKFTFTPAGTR